MECLGSIAATGVLRNHKATGLFSELAQEDPRQKVAVRLPKAKAPGDYPGSFANTSALIQHINGPFTDGGGHFAHLDPQIR
jgi:hypothetical protein